MSRIRGKNTGPERAVRSLLHRAGFRFTLHRKDLPGTPDIVLPKYKTVVLVHGCFWHRHQGCHLAYKPKTRKVFWESKFEENVKRDTKNRDAMSRLGWNVIVVWECELSNPGRLDQRLRTGLTNVLSGQKSDVRGTESHVRF